MYGRLSSCTIHALCFSTISVGNLSYNFKYIFWPVPNADSPRSSFLVIPPIRTFITLNILLLPKFNATLEHPLLYFLLA